MNGKAAIIHIIVYDIYYKTNIQIFIKVLNHSLPRNTVQAAPSYKVTVASDYQH